jgi:Spy/CpxP family protein refolding chaperone
MRKVWLVGLTLIAALALVSASFAQPRGGFLGAGFGLAVGQPGYVNALIRFANDVGLSADQVAKLKSIASSFEKESAKVGADLRVASIELREMLDLKATNIADIEAKVKQVESLKSSIRLSMIKAQIEARNLLTDEQLNKLGSLRGGRIGLRRG